MDINHCSGKGPLVLTMAACMVVCVSAHAGGIMKRSTVPVNEVVTGEKFEVTYDATVSSNSIGKRYSSIALGMKTFNRVNDKQFAVNSLRFKNMLKALAPAMARIGGTEANFVVWKRSDSANDEAVPADTKAKWESEFLMDFYEGTIKSWQNTNVTVEEFADVARFIKSVGMRFMVNLNQMLTRSNGTWDTTNVAKLLDYAAEQDLAIGAFQLANEPNSNYVKFRVARTANETLSGFRVFEDFLLSNDRYQKFRSSLLVGPGVTSIIRHGSAYKYLDEFFGAGARDDIKVMGLHHYHFDGKTADVVDYLDPSYFELITGLVENAKTVLAKYNKISMPIWLTETYAAYNGGTDGMSNRFVSMFSYLDLLGLGAKLGLSQINRQNLQSASYSLLDSDNNPNPDYWLAALFKHLVLGPVFNMTVDPFDPHVRVYGGCANSERGNSIYPRGSLIYYYLNLKDEPVTLYFPRAHSNFKDIYQITRDPNVDTDSGLKSQSVFLNDELLQMDGDDLPTFNPVQQRGLVNVEPYSLGFIVDKRLNNTLCYDFMVSVP